MTGGVAQAELTRRRVAAVREEQVGRRAQVGGDDVLRCRIELHEREDGVAESKAFSASERVDLYESSADAYAVARLEIGDAEDTPCDDLDERMAS